MVGPSASSQLFAPLIARFTDLELEAARDRGYIPYMYYVNKTGGTEICSGGCNEDYVRESAFVSVEAKTMSGIIMLPWDQEAQAFQLREESKYTSATPLWLDIDNLIEMLTRRENFERNGSARYTFSSLPPRECVNISQFLSCT